MSVIEFSLDLGGISGGHTANISQPGPLLSRPEVWKEACDLLSEIRYFVRGGEAKIEIDWSPIHVNAVKESLLSYALYGGLLPAAELAKISEDAAEHRRALRCSVSLSGVEGSEEARVHMASHVIELFLYDVFLLMNLASPGSCELMGTLKSNHEPFERQIHLDSYLLEHAWVTALDNSWPSMQVIPLSEVLAWKNSLAMNTRQIAITRTERATFGLLQVCKGGSYNPATLLWLSHSLEALFDTPVTLIGKFLQQRVVSSLSVPQDKRKDVRKQCSKFYETRSAFVHGTLDIAHPLENEVLDPQVNNLRRRLADAIDFGVSVCLATLQMQILRGWKELAFDEIVSGVPMPSSDVSNVGRR